MGKLRDFIHGQNAQRKEKAEIARLKNDLKSPQVTVKFQAALTLAEREDVNGAAILGCFLDAEDDDLRSKAVEALERLGPKASRGLTELICIRLKELTQLQRDMHYQFSSGDFQGGQLSQAALRAVAMRASGQAIMSVKSQSFINLMKFLVKIGDETNVPTFKLISELIHDRGIREEAAKAIEHLESLAKTTREA